MIGNKGRLSGEFSRVAIIETAGITDDPPNFAGSSKFSTFSRRSQVLLAKSSQMLLSV